MFVVEDLNGAYHYRSGLGKWSLFCVCDGHGGTRAAKFVRSHLGSTLTDLLPLGDPPPFNQPGNSQYYGWIAEEFAADNASPCFTICERTLIKYVITVCDKRNGTDRDRSQN